MFYQITDISDCEISIISYINKAVIILFIDLIDSSDQCNCIPGSLVNDFCCGTGDGSKLCCNIKGIGRSDFRLSPGNDSQELNTQVISHSLYT